MAAAGNSVLRELRKEILGITQTEMADETGLSAVYLSQVETGAHELGRDAGFAILDRYRPTMDRHGITFEDLLRGQRRGAA